MLDASEALLRDKRTSFRYNPLNLTFSGSCRHCAVNLFFIPEAAAAPGSNVGFYATNSLSCFSSTKAVAVGLCPTPYFLFGVQKGSEKDIPRLRRFFTAS